MHSILLPKGYCVFEKETKSWIPIENIPKHSECWDGNKFVNMQTCILPPFRYNINNFILLDSVTSIATLPNLNENMQVDFHCNLPSNCNNSFDNCSDYFFAAIRDYSAIYSFHENEILCKISTSRLPNILKIYNNVQIVQKNKRFTFLLIPLTNIKESTDNCKNALTYIQTVVSLKGLKNQNKYTEIRDDGICLDSSAFRRLRRMISVSGTTSDVILSVNQISNGKKKKSKRQLRLCVKNFIDKQKHCQTCKRLPNHAIRKVVQYKMDHFTNVTWYRVNVQSDSLGVEGLLLLFK